MKTKKQILWITQTAVMLALLIAAQFLTSNVIQIPDPITKQLVTGSCVNAIIVVATLAAGMSSGLVVALFSPFLAFLLQIGPQYFPLIPMIAVGNAALVLVIRLIAGEKSEPIWRLVPAVVVGAAAKFGVLFFGIVKGICPMLANAEATAKQAASFSTMFSWPQLVTALIGGAVAILIFIPLRKALAKMR